MRRMGSVFVSPIIILFAAAAELLGQKPGTPKGRSGVYLRAPFAGQCCDHAWDFCKVRTRTARRCGAEFQSILVSSFCNIDRRFQFLVCVLHRFSAFGSAHLFALGVTWDWRGSFPPSVNRLACYCRLHRHSLTAPRPAWLHNGPPSIKMLGSSLLQR